MFGVHNHTLSCHLHPFNLLAYIEGTLTLGSVHFELIPHQCIQVLKFPGTCHEVTHNDNLVIRLYVDNVARYIPDY